MKEEFQILFSSLIQRYYKYPKENNSLKIAIEYILLYLILKLF